MNACSSQCYVLEHFLRVDTSQPEIWLAALQLLTGSPRLSRQLQSATSTIDFRGRLSFLSSKDLRVSGSYTRNASLISGANAGGVAIIMPVAGTVNFEVAGDHYLCGPWSPFVLDPHEDFHATLSEDTHLLIVQMDRLNRSGYRRVLRHHQTSLAAILTTFLYETPFFRSYRHGQARVDRLARHLLGLIDGGDSPSSVPPQRKQIADDRRLCKAIQLVNDELASDLPIESIASRSGLSLRSLHYLMKQYIGQSPYQYVRGRRLIKAREAIIRHYPNGLGIAQEALNWGFQHAGRFASYYQKHFGEYPNETLRELDYLRQISAQVQSVRMGSEASGHYWLSSSVNQEWGGTTQDQESGQPQDRCF